MGYSLIGIIALFVIIAINFGVIFGKGYKYNNKSALFAYRFLTFSAAIFFVVDAAWGLFDAYLPTIFGHIDTYFYFVSTSILAFAWFRFIAKYLNEKSAFSKAFIIVGYLFAVAGIALTFTNIFTPIFFSYKNGYEPEIGRNIYLIVEASLYIFSSLFALISYVTKKEKAVEHRTIAVSGIAMGLSVGLQYSFPVLPIYGAGLLITISLVHAFIVVGERQRYVKSIADIEKREEEQKKELVVAKELAYKDSLTDAKNKHAYVEFELGMDALIREKKIKEFAIFIFDLNDLKAINDQYGHETGDKYIIRSYELIKECFPYCAIYRFGGDEFVVMVVGDAYKKRFESLDKFNAIIDKHINDDTNEPIIATGFSDFIPEKDNTLRSVFVRADERMYSRKRKLKDLTEGNEKENNDANNKVITNAQRRMNVYEMFYLSDSNSLVDMLNGSNCDEMVDVDLNNDTFTQIYHVQGKYYVPPAVASYHELFEFTAKHIVHPDDLGDYLALMKLDGFFERLKNSKIPDFDFAHFRYKTQSGEYRYVEQCIITGKENGIPDGTFRMYVFDIDNMKMRQTARMEDASGLTNVGRDEMTGLLTAKDFFGEANKIIGEHKENELCLIAIDIEHFKFFGEWYGREQGDHLLAQIGAILSDFEKNHNALAGYFGQDDFAVLTKHDQKEIEDLYDKIRTSIDSFGLTGGLLPAFGVSIIYKGLSSTDAYDRASIASSEAKGNITNRIFTYDVNMQFAVEQEYRVLSDFMLALQNEEITFYLQPQVRVSNRCIVGGEALARWVKKDGTIVSPRVFVPVLEKYGFISNLDKYIWERICKWIRSRLDAKLPVVPVSINVSRVDIFNIDLASFFHDLCEKYNLPHELLKIEITESAYAETGKAIEELVNHLRDDGFLILMDDFGSGYSSLNMLSNLKLDAIKMDAAFLQFTGADYERGVHIIESVINMAKVMALPIIMEGVETKEQCDFIASLGCQYIQGFYYYRPLPIGEFEKLISTKNIIDNRGFVAKANEQFRIREFLDRNIYSDSMLNNIIGSVAIYLLHDNHIDIIRYNQQFYKSVNVPDFLDKLVNIDLLTPEEDREPFFQALKDAKEDKLNGAAATIRFARVDGTYAFFRIHFYYIGSIKEGDRFYGAASNVTELMDMHDSMNLIASYSNDNLIFINKIYDKWHYSVISHGLADIIGVSPKQLEEEMNDGRFAHRTISTKDLKQLMKSANDHEKKNEDFTYELTIRDKNHRRVVIGMEFTCVRGKTTNIDYVLRTRLIKFLD